VLEQVLFVVITDKDRHESHAAEVKRTWGSDAHLFFFSDVPDAELAIVEVETHSEQGRWFAALAWLTVHKNSLTDVKWIVMVDDKTWIGKRHLFDLLALYDYTEPYYIGAPVIDGWEMWASGGAGYALSRGALQRLLPAINRDHTRECVEHKNAMSDVAMGRCLHSLGIALTAERGFHSQQPEFYDTPNECELAPDGAVDFRNGEPAISFHYMTGRMAEPLPNKQDALG